MATKLCAIAGVEAIAGGCVLQALIKELSLVSKPSEPQLLSLEVHIC